MSALNYLFWTKIKGAIRAAVAKKSSLILTIVTIGVIIVSMFFVFTGDNIVVISTGLHSTIMMFLGYIFLMYTTTFMQKRSVIIQKEDAQYVLCGPFSRKKSLLFIVLETVKNSVMIGIVTVFFLLIMVDKSIVSVSFIMMMFLHAILMLYICSIISCYITIAFAGKPNAPLIKKSIIGVMILVAVLLFGYMFVTIGDLQGAFNEFISGDLFYYVPLLGYSKYGLMMFAEGNILGALFGTSILVGLSLFLTWITINNKNDFVEDVLSDAEWYDTLMKDAQAGKDVSLNQKISTVKDYKFRSGAYALMSKTMLVMRKTRGYINKSELFTIALYLIMAYFMGGYLFYQIMFVFILFSISNNAEITSEFKNHYIYLIPDTNFNKLWAIVLPRILKIVLLVVIGFVPCIFIFGTDLMTIVDSMIASIGMGCLFLSAGIWSIKILKDVRNIVVEQLVKMVIMLVSMIPSLLIGGFVLFQTYNMTLASITLGTVSLLFALLLMVASKSIFNGINSQ